MNTEMITVRVGRHALPGYVYNDVANSFGVKDGQHISMAYWSELSVGNELYRRILPVYEATFQKQAYPPYTPPWLPLMYCPDTKNALYISRAVADLYAIDPNLPKFQVNALEFEMIKTTFAEWVDAIFDLLINETKERSNTK